MCRRYFKMENKCSPFLRRKRHANETHLNFVRWRRMYVVWLWTTEWMWLHIRERTTVELSWWGDEEQVCGVTVTLSGGIRHSAVVMEHHKTRWSREREDKQFTTNTETELIGSLQCSFSLYNFLLINTFYSSPEHIYCGLDKCHFVKKMWLTLQVTLSSITVTVTNTSHQFYSPSLFEKHIRICDKIKNPRYIATVIPYQHMGQ